MISLVCSEDFSRLKVTKLRTEVLTAKVIDREIDGYYVTNLKITIDNFNCPCYSIFRTNFFA